MTENPVFTIRESTRSLIKLHRQIQREQRNDDQRLVQNLSINPDMVLRIVNKLKSKSSITVSELQQLKNGLMADSKNIEVVLSTNGSLRGLVRELSGADVKKQLEAAGCLCNLALGDTNACAAIIKAAGPYLIAALDSLSTELAVTCAWTVGNLYGAGGRAHATLTSQGALARLGALLSQGQVAAVYALLHYGYHSESDFSIEHVESILQAYLKLEVDSILAQLMFLLSCKEHIIPHFSEVVLKKIIEDLMISASKHCKQCRGADLCCELIYLIRTLANNVSASNSTAILNMFEVNNVCEGFKCILNSNNSVVSESLLWLLGNLYNHCSDCDFFDML